MNKKLLPNILLTIFVLSISGILIFSVIKSKSQPAGNLSLYVNANCPHCEIVKNYIAENKLEKKFSIEIKDITENVKNLNELMLYSTNCELDMATVGVPLLYESGNCYMGEDEIIDYFIGLTS